MADRDEQLPVWWETMGAQICRVQGGLAIEVDACAEGLMVTIFSTPPPDRPWLRGSGRSILLAWGEQATGMLAAVEKELQSEGDPDLFTLADIAEQKNERTRARRLAKARVLPTTAELAAIAAGLPPGSLPEPE